MLFKKYNALNHPTSPRVINSHALITSHLLFPKKLNSYTGKVDQKSFVVSDRETKHAVERETEKDTKTETTNRLPK
jgi:hypothetical protein